MPIVGVEWRAVLVGGREPVPGSEPAMTVAPGRISGTGGCNQFGSDIAIDPAARTLKVGGVSSTLMGCDGPVGEIEGEFYRLLASAQAFAIDGERLVLRGAAGEIVFSAVRPAP